jgi:hypothetical protein
MTRGKLQVLESLLTEFRNSDYIGLGEMEQLDIVDGLISWVSELSKDYGFWQVDDLIQELEKRDRQIQQIKDLEFGGLLNEQTDQVREATLKEVIKILK